MELEDILNEAYALDRQLLIQLGVIRAIKIKLDQLEKEIVDELEPLQTPQEDHH